MVGKRVKRAKERLEEEFTGERIAKLLEKSPKKAKRRILKRLEQRIEKEGKIVNKLMDKLHMTKDEVKLLFKGISESGFAFETVAREVLEHYGYDIVGKNERIGGREFDLIDKSGTFIECKFTEEGLSKPKFDSYVKALENVLKSDFEPKPEKFIIISARAGVKSTVEKEIDKWKGPFEVEYWGSDEFKEKFIEMKLEKGGLNWKKLADLVFKP